ncbi:hypothetical protein ACIBHX_28595 [Nonomuraea sp. NPDC050536]|uniref:hypothetical protein n=1 Tax=Nonomuraea sp. NPDC050536 TaxID=3364366 RepID=UPI0037C828F1
MRKWLALVALAYVAVQLLVMPRMGLGWDEAVYVSQVNPRVPAADFTAPRARGIPLLVAPMVALTSSVTALRIYLSLASGLALFLSFGTWLRLRLGAVVPLAALLFASLWLAVFYGNEAMPNMWVAFGAVAAAGCYLQIARGEGGRRALAGLAVSVGLVALVRPSDSLWLALPLLAALVLVRRGRRGLTFAILGGLVAGWAEWIAEAWIRFGGLAARWDAAAVDNRTGLTSSLIKHARALDGPLLCRPPAHCGSVLMPWLLWWVSIPLLVGLGLYAARDRLPEVGLATATGVSLALPYLFFVDYAAPRFLLPCYALLAIPIAQGAAWVLTWRPRVVGVGLVALGLAAHFALQGLALWVSNPMRLAARRADQVIAGRLATMGITRPCFLYGDDAVQVAYYVGCRSFGVRVWPTTPALPKPLARTAGEHIAVIARGDAVPAPFLRTWDKNPLTRGWIAYIPH